MANWWDTFTETAKTFGGAAYAPYGVLVDFASAPFDNKDDNVGTMAAKASRRLADVLEPVTSDNTYTGKSVQGVMHGLEWLYREEISDPTSAGITLWGHATHTGDYGSLFSNDAWNKAYKIAQHRSIGQAAVAEGGLFTVDPSKGPDPFDQRAYRQIHDQHPVVASLTSGSIDFMARWYADPGVLIGHAAGAIHAAGGNGLYKLSEADRAGLLDKLSTQQARKFKMPVFDDGMVLTGSKSIGNRTGKYLDWINTGANGKPLNAAQIYYGSKELGRAANGRTIASLLSDATKIPDAALARDAQRRILAVAGGDVDAIARLEAEVSDAAPVADQLKNMLRGTTLELQAQALKPALRNDPSFMGDLQRQLDNLNNEGAIDGFVNDWLLKQKTTLESGHALDYLPGASRAGKKAVARQSGVGLLRNGELASGKAEGVLKPVREQVVDPIREEITKLRANYQSASTVFQRTQYGVPLLVIKTAGIAASPWTRFPIKAADALRTTHYTGLANLHDWEGATTQIDSMLRAADVPHGERLSLLSEAFGAKAGGEAAQVSVITKAEASALKGLAAKHAARFPEQEIDAAFIEQLVKDGAKDKLSRLTSLRGRAYGATENVPADMAALRQGPMAAAEANATGMAHRADLSEGGLKHTLTAPLRGVADAEGGWGRVDQLPLQLDEHGTPTALPVLETQLAQTVPMIDVHLMDKVLKENGGYLSRQAKIWQAAREEIGVLSQAKGVASDVLENVIAGKRMVMDTALEMASFAMRMWKFSVLFRLGYPMRVVMDDHMRIWSKIGAEIYTDNAKESAKNFGYNQGPRHWEANKKFVAAQVRLRDLRDRLDTVEASTWKARQDEIAKLSRSVSGKQNAVNRWQAELDKINDPLYIQVYGRDRAKLNDLRDKIKAAQGEIEDKNAAVGHLAADLGDNPDDWAKEAAELEALVKGGPKKFLDPKRTVGEAPVPLANGQEVSAPFGGDYGKAARGLSSSEGMTAEIVDGTQESTYRAASQRSFDIISNQAAGHLDAWASVLNHQFRQSKAAMFFIKGKGDVNDFARWVREPEQASLRERVSHFSHDPENWGWRIQQLVDDYLPIGAVREKFLEGNITARDLGKLMPTPSLRPDVHGATVAENLGHGFGTKVSNTMNGIYKFLGEIPTDRLSRHPYFASVYRHHAQTLAQRRLNASPGYRFTEKDLADIEAKARARALSDLKQTLFDISAHSHAAHVMRFISPFFAAHQESLSRWWRIVSDDPSIIRRFQQGFDMPRKLALTVDENGDLVKSGDPISVNNRVLLQVPHAWGGPKVDKNNPTSMSKWSISENAFNLVLQGGLTNPGVGPLVTLPVEYLTRKYADKPEIERVARVLNPYAPTSPWEVLAPAWGKRLNAALRHESSTDYNASFQQNIQDLTVQFKLRHDGAEPSAAQSEELMQQAGHQTNVDAWLRVLWNTTSPAPATPKGKYAAVMYGWDQITAAADARGEDFDWALQRFKDKYGEIYMPLISSASNNPSNIEITTGAVAAFKKYKPLLQSVDPALRRLVMGSEQDGEYSSAARSFFLNTRMRPGSDERYLGYDDPATAAEEQMARRGWEKYSAYTAMLTNAAQQYGFKSYLDSDVLMEAKRQMTTKLAQDNWAWAKDYSQWDSTEYDRLLPGLEKVADSGLMKGAERSDIKAVKSYLNVRQAITSFLAQRKKAGLTYTSDAQDLEPVFKAFTAYVSGLVESNTMFQEYAFDGLIERDPYLIGAS